jgi:hypothetical protein
MTLQPAYGRDYKSKAAAIADLIAGKDFLGTDPSIGLYEKPTNIRSLREAGVKLVSIRYAALRRVASYQIPDETA